jgi:hypothetical protein
MDERMPTVNENVPMKGQKFGSQGARPTAGRQSWTRYQIRMGARWPPRCAERHTSTPVDVVHLFDQKARGCTGPMPYTTPRMDAGRYRSYALVHRQQRLPDVDRRTAWPDCRGGSPQATGPRRHRLESGRVRGDVTTTMRVAGLNTVTNRRAEGYEQMRPRSGQARPLSRRPFPDRGKRGWKTGTRSIAKNLRLIENNRPPECSLEAQPSTSPW